MSENVNVNEGGDTSSRSGRSGLAFEIPVPSRSPTHTPRRLPNALNASLNGSTREISEEVIIEKLKNAEQRRRSIEVGKTEQIREKRNVNVKRIADKLCKLSLELESHKECVQKKLEKSAERRGSLLQERKEKLTQHLHLLKDVQNKLEEARAACRTRVQERLSVKLASSDAQRSAILSAKREKAAAHSAHAEAVRATKKALETSGLNDSFARAANDTALSTSCCASPSPSSASMCGCVGEQIVSPCPGRQQSTQ